MHVRVLKSLVGNRSGRPLGGMERKRKRVRIAVNLRRARAEITGENVAGLVVRLVAEVTTAARPPAAAAATPFCHSTAGRLPDPRRRPICAHSFNYRVHPLGRSETAAAAAAAATRAKFIVSRDESRYRKPPPSRCHPAPRRPSKTRAKFGGGTTRGQGRIEEGALPSPPITFPGPTSVKGPYFKSVTLRNHWYFIFNVAFVSNNTAKIFFFMKKKEILSIFRKNLKENYDDNIFIFWRIAIFTVFGHDLP